MPKYGLARFVRRLPALVMSLTPQAWSSVHVPGIWIRTTRHPGVLASPITIAIVQ
jgi:hypothetical protein